MIHSQKRETYKYGICYILLGTNNSDHNYSNMAVKNWGD